MTEPDGAYEALLWERQELEFEVEKLRKELGKDVVTKLSWRWHTGPGITKLREALEPFGIEVSRDPEAAGEESFGFILRRKATSEEKG